MTLTVHQPAPPHVEMKARLAAAVEAHRGEIVQLSHRIHAHPEVAFEEQHAAEWVAAAVARHGYAVAHPAGRLPDAVQLHFLESGLIGRVDVEPKRLAKARRQIAQAAAGIRARDYTARPDYLSCTYCAFRDICPASAAT